MTMTVYDFDGTTLMQSFTFDDLSEEEIEQTKPVFEAHGWEVEVSE